MLLIFTGAFLTALSGALAPGPFLTWVIARSLAKGPWTGPLAVLGHMLLEFGLLLALLFGLGGFFRQRLPLAAVFLAGGLILIWMSVDLIAGSRNAPLRSAARPKTSTALHPVLAGVLLSLSNPYWLVWWLVVGFGYLMQARKFGLPGIAAFFCGHILADLAWYSFVSFGAGAGRKFAGDRIYRLVLEICGVLLLGFGGWFLVSGVVKLAAR